MHDLILLGYLGLTANEVKAVRSIFTISAELKNNYQLASEKEVNNSDLVLVNVDNREAVYRWGKISHKNKLATPITLSAKGRVFKGIVPLSLPIRLQSLIEALQKVASESTKFNIPPDASKDSTPIQILVVDDSYPVRKYMELKLTDIVEEPLRLSFAESGEEAMKKFGTRVFDMVFLDVMMEGADGYKVCRAIKSVYKSYVVMLTSKKSPFDKIRGTMSGCDTYITKPPADQRLIEEISKCLNRLSIPGRNTN